MSGRSRQGGGHHAGGADGTGGPPWLLSFGERNDAHPYPYPTQKRRDDPSSSMLSRPVVEEVYYYDQPPMRPSRTDSSASYRSGTGTDGFVTRTEDFGGQVLLHSSKDPKGSSTKVKTTDQLRYYGTYGAPTVPKATHFSHFLIQGARRPRNAPAAAADPSIRVGTSPTPITSATTASPKSRSRGRPRSDLT